jgi:hypothetical protein
MLSPLRLDNCHIAHTFALAVNWLDRAMFRRELIIGGLHCGTEQPFFGLLRWGIAEQTVGRAED